MKTIMLIMTLFSSVSAFGWGGLGHEATAIIATDHLSSTAKAKINSMLISSDTFLKAVNWPDSVRTQSQWHHTKPFHFTQVADNSTYFAHLGADGDAVRALVKAEDILRSDRSTKVQKRYAFKFLIHVLGDIHQPLHTGRPEDLGGNMISLLWFGKKDNLHSVWDTGMIHAKMGLTANAQDYVNQMAKPTAEEIRQWEKGSFLEWHDEAFALRSFPYASVVMSNEDVMKQYSPVVEKQIQKAGFRIAHVLNNIFENRSVSAEGQTLRREFETQIGPEYSREILLAPMDRRLRNQNLKTDLTFECSHE